MLGLKLRTGVIITDFLPSPEQLVLKEKTIKVTIKKYHADFDYEVVNDVVAVFDLNLGNNSVTNAIHCMLEILKSRLII